MHNLDNRSTLLSDKKIVVIGGGTGSFTLLSVLKHYCKNLTAIVNMSDDGGSSGVLRDELGVLPPGDVRQCLVALAEESDRLRELFNYRFEDGGLKGHSFGNLFLSSLEKITGSFAEAVAESARILKISGQVLPVTLTDSQLVLHTADGQEVIGQHIIANIDLKGKLPDLRLSPESELNPAAAEVINDADLIVIAPGHLYGSLIPALLVNGIKSALYSTRAKIAYVCNLVTKPGQSDGFQVHDYANEIERFIGAGRLNYVIYNNQKPAMPLLENYAKEGEYWVEYDNAQLETAAYQAIGAALISSTVASRSAGDNLPSRTFIRHDAKVVADILAELDNITKNPI